MHAGIPPPPWDQAHPPKQTPRDQAPPRTRHTPLRTRHTPPGPGTLRPGTPPQCRACWEIRSTRGRYASYWNAILFLMNSATRNQQSKGIYWLTSREHFIHPTTNSSDQLEHRTFCHSLLSLILVQFCEKSAVLFCESQLF